MINDSILHRKKDGVHVGLRACSIIRQTGSVDCYLTLINDWLEGSPTRQANQETCIVMSDAATIANTENSFSVYSRIGGNFQS